MMDFFEELLKITGQMLGTTLRPDSQHSCSIVIREKVIIQLELDRMQENIILGSLIGELLPGAYRKEVLLSALKANPVTSPLFGTFAFSKKNNALVFFHKTPVKNFDADFFLAMLPYFIFAAEKWREKIERGEMPDLDLSSIPSVS